MLTNVYRRFVLLFVIFLSLSSQSLAFDFGKNKEPLAPEQAFKLNIVDITPKSITVQYQIAEGYYLYRPQFNFALKPTTPHLGAAILPKGKEKSDPFFGRVETYRNSVLITLPLTAPLKNPEVHTLIAKSRGCADIGICYPSYTHQIPLKITPAGNALDKFLSGEKKIKPAKPN